MLSTISKNSLLKFKNTNKFRLLVCAASGILSSISFFFEELFLLQWISFVPFFWVLSQEITKKQAFFYGFFTRFIQSVLVLSWFKELYSMSSVDVSPILMIFVIFLGDVVLSALQAIPFGLCSLLIRTVYKTGKSKSLNIFSAAVFFTFTELFQTLIEQTGFLGLIGFPWVVTYVTQHKFNIAIQSASIFGAMFITFLITLINALIANAITAEKKERMVSIIIAASLFVINMLYGISVTAYSHTGDENTKINAVVYQDNNSSYSKWSSSPRDVCDIFIEDMENYFSEGNKADIIVMSETVFTTTFDTNYIYNAGSARYVSEKLQKFTQNHNCTLIFGGFSSDKKGSHNSMFVIENGRFNEKVYNKRTLVPFGEYLPYEKTLSKLIPSLESFNLSGSHLVPGDSPEVFECKLANIGAIICYDSIFYYNTNKSVLNGAELIALSTNDSWYNDSSAIYQHYAQSAFRAIETGRYLLRSATTGISGIFDDHGRTVAKSDIFEKCILSGVVQTKSNITLFSKFGYAYLYLLTIICLVYTSISVIESKKHKHDNI